MPKLSDEKISSIVTGLTDHCMYLLTEEFELEGEEFPRQVVKTTMLAEMRAVLRRFFGDDGGKCSRKGAENDVKLEALEGMVGKLTKLVTGMARELKETKENGSSALEILKSWQSGEEVHEDEASLSIWDEFQDVEESDKSEEVTHPVSRGKKRKARTPSTRSASKLKPESIDSPKTSTKKDEVNHLSTACFQPCCCNFIFQYVVRRTDGLHDPSKESRWDYLRRNHWPKWAQSPKILVSWLIYCHFSLNSPLRKSNHPKASQTKPSTIPTTSNHTKSTKSISSATPRINDG